MFNLFSAPSTTSTTQSAMPNPSSIRQANEQLARMASRVRDLEVRTCEQAELLQRRDAEHGERYNKLRASAEADHRALVEQVRSAEQRALKAENALRERDVTIAFLLHRCSFIDEAASYAPLLEHLVATLKNAGMAVHSTKVQTVKPRKQDDKFIPGSHEGDQTDAGSRQHSSENNGQTLQRDRQQPQQQHQTRFQHRPSHQGNQHPQTEPQESNPATIEPSHSSMNAHQTPADIPTTTSREQSQMLLSVKQLHSSFGMPKQTGHNKSVFVTNSVPPGTYVPVSHFQQAYGHRDN